jgi:hypothetical protein
MVRPNWRLLIVPSAVRGCVGKDFSVSTSAVRLSVDAMTELSKKYMLYPRFAHLAVRQSVSKSRKYGQFKDLEEARRLYAEAAEQTSKNGRTIELAALKDDLSTTHSEFIILSGLLQT